MSRGSKSLPISTMRAWLWTSAVGGLEKNLFLSESATPPGQTLRQDQVLVHVISAALNPADYKIPEMGYFVKFFIPTPASPGMDFCGRVVATGPAASGFVSGQLVYGCLARPLRFGALSEYLVASAAQLVPLQEGLDPDHAASFGIAGQTAYMSIQPNITAGSRIFINGGSGGCGIFAIQIAKVLQCHVTVSCSTRNVQFCKDLGADEVIDYTSGDLVEALKAKGQVFDLMVDHVGLPANLYPECHHFLLPGKKFVQVGVQSHWTAIDRLLRPSLLGGGKRKFEILLFKSLKSWLTQLGDWVQEGKIKVVIDSAFNFEDAVKAYEKLKTGRARGKIVVHVSGKPS